MESIPNSSLTGWLYCKRNLKQTWERRYFALHNSYIDYYKSDKDLKTKCVIPLGLAICYTLFENETTRTHVFAIKTALREDKTFFLSADTLDEHERWVLSVRAAMLRTFSLVNSLPTPSSAISTDALNLINCKRRSSQLVKRGSNSINTMVQISRPVLQSVSSRRRIALPESSSNFLHKVAKNPLYNPHALLEGEISLFVANVEIRQRNKFSKFLVFQIEVQFRDLRWTIFRTFEQCQSLDKKVGSLMWPRFKISKRLDFKALSLLTEKRWKRMSSQITGYAMHFSQTDANKRDLEAFYSFIKPGQYGDIKESGFDFSVFKC